MAAACAVGAVKADSLPQDIPPGETMRRALRRRARDRLGILTVSLDLARALAGPVTVFPN
ncbi:MAG: hypothetical protein QNJ16_17660 [Rhodobacter sp.]|nr:hypothetical protein [Rhodobacter sp.]